MKSSLLCRRCYCRWPTLFQQPPAAPPCLSKPSKPRTISSSQPRCSSRSASITIPSPPVDLSTALAKPKWSVRTLLPEEKISPKTLHHLLRLSSLPPPKTPEEEASMISTLQSQLRFVRDIQSVDTTNIEPLQAIRDETAEGEKEITIGLDSLKHVLEQEYIVGHNKRPRRRKNLPVDTKGAEDWDALCTASKKVGRYFVVESGTLRGGE